MKTRTWMAGIAAVATLFAAMTAPASAMAEEPAAPDVPQTSTNCTTKGNIITVKGKDADAFRTWTDNGKTPLGNRTFSVAKVADYKIDNGESGGLVHLETVNGSKPDIIQAVKDLSANAGKSLYENEDHDGDPMNWLANTKNDMLIRRYAEHPGVTGSALEAADVDGNGTVALTDALLALRIAING